jgi:hypothetical protein
LYLDATGVVRRACQETLHNPEGLGFRVQGLGFRVKGLGCRVQNSGFRVEGLGFKGSRV